MKLLIVEDDPNLDALWRPTLLRAGHEVRVERTEAAARAALSEQQYDLVLVELCLGDAAMVDMAGLGALLPFEARIVIVTGTLRYARETLFEMSPAVSAVLRKPVDIEDLLAVCEHVGNGVALPPGRRGINSAVALRF